MAMLTRFDPFRDIQRMQEEVGRLFDDRLIARGGESVGWTPACDIFEDDEGVALRFELAGVDPKEVDIRFENGVLTMRGERKLEQEPASLLYLLGDRNRLAYLGGVVEVFSALADEKMGRLRAQITSAAPLDQGAAKNLAEKLARATKAEVILDRAVDPGLLGGVVAQVGRLTYDGSIRTQLEDLRRSLKQ